MRCHIGRYYLSTLSIKVKIEICEMKYDGVQTQDEHKAMKLNKL